MTTPKPPFEWASEMLGLFHRGRFYANPEAYFYSHPNEDETTIYEARRRGGRLYAEDVLWGHDEKYGSPDPWNPNSAAFAELQAALDCWAEKYPAPLFFGAGALVVIRRGQPQEVKP